MRVALVGAPRTGKSTLARELCAALDAAHGVEVEDAPAPERCRAADLTLLMGVDLPGADAAADVPLRHSLQRAGIAYHVIYGRGPARLQAALAVIAPRLPGAVRPEPAPVRWVWNCERCGDADCEHRLFRL